MSVASPAPSPVIRQRVLELVGALVHVRDEAEVTHAVAAAVAEIGRADDVVVALVDPSRGLLWRGDQEWTWDDGVVGAAARAAQIVSDTVSKVDAAGVLSGSAHLGDLLTAFPLVGAAGAVHAVAAVVSPSAGPLAREEAAAIEDYCARAGRMLDHVAEALDAKQDFVAPTSIYRAEAVAALGRPSYRHMVAIVPPWAGMAAWLLTAIVVVAVVFLAIASKYRYSTGPAIVHDDRRQAVVAHEAGTVGTIDVRAGQTVVAGQRIAMVDDALLRADLVRLGVQLEARIRQHLLEPQDTSVADAVADLQQRVRAAKEQLRAHEIRASVGGVIADVRAEVGRPIAIGDVVATIDTGTGGIAVLAFLPGGDRPAIAPGMRVRLEIPGYRHQYEWFTIESIDDGAIGPREVARLMGSERADAITLAGPTVIARGELPEAFAVDDRRYAYHDGMLGIADVRLEREPMLFVLLPFLAEVLR